MQRIARAISNSEYWLPMSSGRCRPNWELMEDILVVLWRLGEVAVRYHQDIWWGGQKWRVAKGGPLVLYVENLSLINHGQGGGVVNAMLCYEKPSNGILS